jgi:heat-inducible transcriptional repressor
VDERKAAILRAVVEAYIDQAQPVGSAQLAGLPGLEVSTATIRNELASLERDGYLVQPHTSAGRIPTEQGYRFFVDSLGGPGVLSEADVRRVRDFFGHARGEIERRLADTSRLLADLTSHAALVIGPAKDPAVVRSVQLVELSTGTLLLVEVLSDGAVAKRLVDVPSDLAPEVVHQVTARLNDAMIGHDSSALLSVGPSGDPAADQVLAALQQAADTATPAPLYVGGTSLMAQHFAAVDTVRQVLEILEEQLVVVGLIGDLITRGLSVAIGSETGLEPLAECAVVVAPYSIGGGETGSIGILGPTRMDYGRAMAAVTVVSRRLSSSLEAAASSGAL